MQVGTHSSIESPTKLSGNTDQGLMKKSKGFDGLAMSIGNCNAESAEHGAENRQSQRFVDLFSFYMIIIRMNSTSLFPNIEHWSMSYSSRLI